MQTKQEFRAKLKARADAVDRSADAIITERVLNLDSFKRANCILAYISIGYEVDTYRLIECALSIGKRVCVPRCYVGGVMDAVEIFSISDLKPGMYGIPEPDADSPAVDPSELDFILVPGMAYDRARNRLGRGAGYYDRFLERSQQATTVGVCRGNRLFDAIPHEAHDKQVDFVVTEHEMLQKDDK